MESLRNMVEIKNYRNYNSDVVLENDDDADYRPVLQGIINTRCNYDGGKIEGSLEQ